MANVRFAPIADIPRRGNWGLFKTRKQHGLRSIVCGCEKATACAQEAIAVSLPHIGALRIDIDQRRLLAEVECARAVAWSSASIWRALAWDSIMATTLSSLGVGRR